MGLFDSSNLSIHDVFLRMTGYKLGSWFYIRDDLTGFSTKGGPRPLVLVSDYLGGPTALAFPRSSTRKSGIEHAAHPGGHDRDCKIDCHGWIPTLRISLDSDWLRGTYTCFEPYEITIKAIHDSRGVA